MLERWFIGLVHQPIMAFLRVEFRILSPAISERLSGYSTGVVGDQQA
jgi:hypothetical protein